VSGIWSESFGVVSFGISSVEPLGSTIRGVLT